MFQTFSKAWGIKPKPSLVISKIELPEEHNVKVEPIIRDNNTIEELEKTIEREVAKALERAKALEAKPMEIAKPTELAKPKEIVKTVEKEVRVKEVKEVQERPKEETVSLAYHKHVIYLLFLLNIISLIVVFLLAVLK